MTRQHQTSWRAPWIIVFVAVVACHGCSASHRRPRYRTVQPSLDRDSLTAQRLNRKGLVAIEQSDLKRAEERFREALEHDLYYAPAHNNLGLVLLRTEQYYEAAWEFDYAAKLAPGAAEPRQNLGLLYEHLGHVDRAIKEYEAARELEPENAVTMRHLARAYVKTDRNGDTLKELLEKLLHIPSDKQWDTWARGQLIRLGRAEPGPSPPPLGSTP